MLDDIAIIADQYNPDLRHAIVYEYNHKGKHIIPHYRSHEGMRQFTRMEMKKINRYLKRHKLIMRFGDVIRANYRCITNLHTVPKTSCNLYVYDGQRVQKYGCCNVKQIFQVWRPHPSTGIFMNSWYWIRIFPHQHVFVNISNLPSPTIHMKTRYSFNVNGKKLCLHICYGNLKFIISGSSLIRCELTSDPNNLLFIRTQRHYHYRY